MAARELVILSSSPLRAGPPAARDTTPPSNQKHANMSSFSYDSPSPRLEFPKKPSAALRTGSRANPVPEGAIAGFATAGSLVRNQHLSLEDDDSVVEIEPPKQKKRSNKSEDAPPSPVRVASKSRTKISTPEDGEAKLKKPRQRKPKASTTTEPDDTSATKKAPRRAAKPKVSNYFAESTESLVDTPAADAKIPKPRKPRAKKEKVEKPETQTTLKKGKVTKPRAHTSGAKEAGLKPESSVNEISGVVSSHFPIESSKLNKQGTTGKLPSKRGANKVLQENGSLDHQLDDDSIWEVPADSERVTKKPHAKPNPSSALQDEELFLDSATRRRRDWTPPKDTDPVIHSVESTSKENNPEVLPNELRGAGIILSGFAYHETKETTPAPLLRAASTEAVLKRRRIELVEVPCNQTATFSRNTSPEKGKAPKKKPRTITDLALAQYAPTETADDLNVEPAASDFFSPRTTKIPLNDVPVNARKDARPKTTRRRVSSENSAKAEAKSKKANAKAKATAKLRANKLLSPASAAQRMNNQDILFGTSSQLAREESPTFVRQMQQAIRESEAEAELLLGMRSVAPKRPSRLWSAAARDLDNGLLENDEVVYFPSELVDVAIPIMTDVTRENVVKEESFVDIDDFEPIKVTSPYKSPSTTKRLSPVSSPPPSAPGLQENEVEPHLASNDASFTDIDHYTGPPTPQAQLSHESSFVDIDDFVLPTQPASNTLISNAKPHPSTSLPTSILCSPSTQKLHASKPSSTLASHAPPSPQTLVPKTSANPKPKPVSRGTTATSPPSTPHKTVRARKFAHIDEIQDSEDDSSLSPTPPRISRLPASQSIPLDLRPTLSLPPPPQPPLHSTTTANTHPQPPIIYRRPLSDLSWATSKPTIFRQISTTIRNLPPSRNPHKPNYHEKILMYDPLVLEDFTSWLNDQGSVQVWKKATLKQVRDYRRIKKAEEKERKAAEKLERKALGLKGSKTVGSKDVDEWLDIDDIDTGDEELVDAVRTELEVWMVKEWCQEFSVCCVNKEKVAWGGRKAVF